MLDQYQNLLSSRDRPRGKDRPLYTCLLGPRKNDCQILFCRLSARYTGSYAIFGAGRACSRNARRLSIHRILGGMENSRMPRINWRDILFQRDSARGCYRRLRSPQRPALCWVCLGSSRRGRFFSYLILVIRPPVW